MQRDWQAQSTEAIMQLQIGMILIYDLDSGDDNKHFEAPRFMSNSTSRSILAVAVHLAFLLRRWAEV